MRLCFHQILQWVFIDLVTFLKHFHIAWVLLSCLLFSTNSPPPLSSPDPHKKVNGMSNVKWCQAHRISSCFSLSTEIKAFCPGVSGQSAVVLAPLSSPFFAWPWPEHPAGRQTYTYLPAYPVSVWGCIVCLASKASATLSHCHRSSQRWQRANGSKYAQSAHAGSDTHIVLAETHTCTRVHAHTITPRHKKMKREPFEARRQCNRWNLGCGSEEGLLWCLWSLALLSGDVNVVPTRFTRKIPTPHLGFDVPCVHFPGWKQASTWWNITLTM